MLNAGPIAERNKKIIQSYFLDMWNNNDTALTDKLVAESYTHHKPDGQITRGRDQIKNIMKLTFEKYPNINFRIKHVVSEGDMVATLLEGIGTDKSTGEVKHFNEAFFHRVKDKEIIEGWIIY